MTRPVGIRWWPAALILALAVLLWGLIRAADTDRQSQVMQSLGVLLLTVLLLLLWVAFLSRLPRRGWWTLGLIALLVGFGTLFRIVGVDGDLMPILEWRFQSEVAAPDVGRASAVDIEPTGHDFPQALGPQRDSRVDLQLVDDWKASPPQELWRQPVGPGWAGFAVVGQLAVTHSQSGDEEVVLALDLATGEPRWSFSYPARYDTTVGGVGPRTVPTIAAGRVFALGGTGVLTALDLASGEKLWQRAVVDEAVLPDWGKSGAPLVLDDVVVVSPGGEGQSLAAYEIEDGELRWSAGSDLPSYSSPTLLELDGVEQIVVFNQTSVVGHDPLSGELLWRHPVPEYQPNVTNPIALDHDSFLVSTGYGIGSRRLQVQGGGEATWSVTEEWTSTRLKSKFANLILEQGVLYGLDDGVLAAVDPTNGERLWKRGRYGHGQLLLVKDLLLVQTEKGELVLLSVTAQGAEERARYQVFSGKTWNPPALAGDVLLVRNDEEAVALRLPSL